MRLKPVGLRLDPVAYENLRRVCCVEMAGVVSRAARWRTHKKFRSYSGRFGRESDHTVLDMSRVDNSFAAGMSPLN
jgi:hypothetical protein